MISNFTHIHGDLLISVMHIDHDFNYHPNKVVAVVLDQYFKVHSRHYFDETCDRDYIISEVINDIECDETDPKIPNEDIRIDPDTGLHILTTSEKLPSIRAVRYLSPEKPVVFEFNHRLKCDFGGILYKYIEVPYLNVYDNVVYDGVEYTVRFIQQRENRDGVDAFKYYCSDSDMNLMIINGGSCVQAVYRGKGSRERLNKQVSVRIPMYLWQIIRDGVDANSTTNSIINDSLHSIIGQFLKENPVR